MTEPKNDRNHAVTKFCLELEKHRRSDGGRVRTAKEFLDHFFPHDDREATDRIFLHMPNTVRGPILAKWGIRGARAALKDDAPKIKLVVHDALIAGDVDENSFESGIDAATIIDWIDLPAWWTFWRSGKLTGAAVQKALATVRALALIDDAWFLASLRGRAGKTKGTDVVCEMLAKDQLVAWIRKIHETGDASPTGLIQAIGWDVVLAKTPFDALLSVLDEFARKAGLALQEPFVKRSSVEMTPPPIEPLTARHQRLPEARMTLSAPFDAAAIAEADALANVALRDSQASSKVRSIPHGGEESSKLAEARDAVLNVLAQSGSAASQHVPFESEPPAHPSSLEWPEPPAAASDALQMLDAPIVVDCDILESTSIDKPTGSPQRDSTPPQAF